LTLSLNIAMTLDGRVALPDGRWHSLSSRLDRLRMEEIRNAHDLIVLGKNSVLRDNPNIPDPPPSGLLLCRNYIPDLTRRFLRKRPCILMNRALKSRSRHLEKIARISYCAPGDFELPAVLRKIRSMGFRRILFETGPAFNRLLLAGDLLDRLYITIVPFICGSSELPALLAGNRPL
jgi:riboflavin biosynthesis pyrimidine reductase